MKGVVRWFSAERGYGFLRSDDDGKDTFVHYTGIVGKGYRQLEQGAKIEYEIDATGDRPKAVNVQVYQ